MNKDPFMSLISIITFILFLYALAAAIAYHHDQQLNHERIKYKHQIKTLQSALNECSNSNTELENKRLNR